MITKQFIITTVTMLIGIMARTGAMAQIGTRFPSERRVVRDSVTGTMLTFLTTKPAGDSQIYHPHPTFSPDGTRIQIQSAMLSADNRSMNICIVPVPADWLKRYPGN